MKVSVNLFENTNPYELFYLNGSYEGCGAFGDINKEAIREFNPYNHNDEPKLYMPIKIIDDVKYFDINYIYKNILMRVSNINKKYLTKIAENVGGNILEQKYYIKYNEYTDKTYIKTYTYVTQNVIEYILSNYSSFGHILYNDFESFIMQMYNEKYNGHSSLIKHDEDKLRINAKKYVRHVYLVHELNMMLNKHINICDFERMTVKSKQN